MWPQQRRKGSDGPVCHGQRNHVSGSATSPCRSHTPRVPWGDCSGPSICLLYVQSSLEGYERETDTQKGGCRKWSFVLSRLSCRICQPKSSFSEWQEEVHVQGHRKWPGLNADLPLAAILLPGLLICTKLQGALATQNQMHLFNIHSYTLMKI